MNYKSLLLATIFSLSSVSAFAEVVNLNKADASAFQYYLNGIGEKKANKIVNYRQQHKEFKSIAEIMEVKGIGKGIFTKINADLSLTEGKVSAPTKKAKIKKENIETVEEKKKELVVESTTTNLASDISDTEEKTSVENKISPKKERQLKIEEGEVKKVEKAEKAEKVEEQKTTKEAYL